jgi:hypothetical protein
MADNAPFSVNRPPFPNEVILINRRVETHVATITVASGTPTVNTSLSSAGITVANGAAGIYEIGFPPGGTGAIGWTVVAAVSQSTPAAVEFSVDSDTTNYATGVLSLRAFDAATPGAVDVEGNITCLISVIKAAP